MSETPTPSEKRVVGFAALDDDRAVSRHELSRYLAGELGPERRAELERMVESDDGLRATLQDLKAARDAFFATMPFERFAADHTARREKEAGPFAALWKKLRWQLSGGLVVATAAAALAVFVLPNVGGEAPGSSENRVKGGARIGIFVREDGGARVGKDGEALKAGDQIQFMVKDAPAAKARVIIGIDGSGAITVYDKSSFASSTAKGHDDGEPAVIGSSIVLDDAVGAERFFVLYGDEDVAMLETRARAAAKGLVKRGLPLESTERLPVETIAQSSIHIVKVPSSPAQ